MTDSIERPASQPDTQSTPESELPGRGEALIPTIETAPDTPVLDRFWVAVRRLPKYLKLAASMARDSHVPVPAKIALAFGGVYTVSPVDLVPGIIPVAGQLDDLVVLLLALRTAVRACPPEVAAEQLERAGLTAHDFDDDLAATKDTALWLAGKGFAASRVAARAAGRGAASLWRMRPWAA